MKDEATNKLAWRIYEVLKEKGCEIGTVSVTFIQRELEGFVSRARDEVLEEAAGVADAFSDQLIDSHADHEAYEGGGIACHNIAQRIRALKSVG